MTRGGSFVDLQSGFFRDVAPETEPQNSIVCDLVFLNPNAYERYREFTDWVNAAAELFLVYVSYGTTEYYRKISVEYLTKTELTAGKWLTVPFSVSCLTPWYPAVPGTLEITPSAAKLNCINAVVITQRKVGGILSLSLFCYIRLFLQTGDMLSQRFVYRFPVNVLVRVVIDKPAFFLHTF